MSHMDVMLKLGSWNVRGLSFKKVQDNDFFYIVNKHARNKNARHIFPHHYFPVAMIGSICLHMHFVMNTRSIFSNTYTTSGNMTITAQNARARRALQPRGFSKQNKMFLTLLRSFTEQKT